MRVGFVLVAGGMLTVYAHIGLFQLLDGSIGVRSSDDYHYLKRDKTVATGYGDYHNFREHVTTLACTWKVHTGRHGPVVIMLSINSEARPQLLLMPSRRRYPGTPDGWQELVGYLWRADPLGLTGADPLRRGRRPTPESGRHDRRAGRTPR